MLIDLFKDIPLFSCLNDDLLNYLERIAVQKNFPKGTLLFSKGDESDALYIVAEGKVKAIADDELGKEIVLSIHGPGEYFGEMALLDGETRSATIITTEATRLAVIYKDDFMKILSSSPDMMFVIVKILLERLRRATEKIEGLAFRDVYGRIVDLLVQLMEPKGQMWVIDEKLTHQEIANRVGASREMVSKIMGKLADGGYISVDKKHIKIIKKFPYSY